MSEYIIVKGDVSGIQDFIFNVKSDGAAKELKGKSFFIKILVEVVMKHFFTNADNLNYEKLENYKITTSGGNFIIKLPYTEYNKKLVEDSQILFNKSLQYTVLNISIVSVKYNSSNTNKDYYKETIQSLNNESRKNKLKFLLEEISFFKPLNKKDFNFYDFYNNNKISKWEKITFKLSICTHILIQKNDRNKELKLANSISLAGYSILFINSNDQSLNGDEIPLLNYLESLFPKFKSYNTNFENLSKFGSYNKGANKLAALSMDVDGLGNVIEAIKNESDHKELDKKLNTFFNITLRNQINNKFQNKVYTVTAGGDDTLFVGKWNTMLDLAISINNSFKKAFENENITISAGLVIINPKFPVIRFAQLADASLKKAKYKYPKHKGNICLFNEVIQWNKVNEINKLRLNFKKTGTTGGLLAKARQIAAKGVDQPIKLEDFWKMGYYLRNTNNRVIRDIEKHFNNSINTTNKLEKRNHRLITPIAARLAELDEKKKKHGTQKNIIK